MAVNVAREVRSAGERELFLLTIRQHALSTSRCSAPFAKRTSGTRAKPARHSAAVNERAKHLCHANCTIFVINNAFCPRDTRERMAAERVQ